MARERIILHIDMNSYFATVEQQANFFLRGRPIVVTGKEGSRSVIVASSREAKKLGIKTGMTHYMAKKICPKLIFVEPDGEKYEYLTRQFIDILKKYTDKVEVFSIDEAFLDLTGYALSFNVAEAIALKIKKDFKIELGEWISCSIGISENKLLAKFASDSKKPDGLVVIDQKNKEQFLLNAQLTDFCGIGRRVERRLDDLGIDSISKLREYPAKGLENYCGHFLANKLYNLSRGIDYDPVAGESEEVKSVSRSYTLPHNTFDLEEINSVLFHLCEKSCRELRSKKLSGKTVQCYLRYEDFSHTGFSSTLPQYINNEIQLFQLMSSAIRSLRLIKPVRLVGVRISNLISGVIQPPLWEQERKLQKAADFVDKINNAYGELTIKPAYMLKSSGLRKKVGGFRLVN